MMSSNFCVVCNSEIPEGRHVCSICEQKMLSGVTDVWDGGCCAAIAEPKSPNIELSFGEKSGPNFCINYRRAKPLNKFQIWMFKVCFGVTAKNM